MHCMLFTSSFGNESRVGDLLGRNKNANVAEKRRHHNYDFSNSEIGRSYGKVFSFLHDGQAMTVLDTFVSLVDYIGRKLAINDKSETG